jgi:hypothetical protein
MSALFTLPKVISLPGAKLTFTQTLTSTPQDTYQDNARQTAHSNPVVADANGVFEPIYLDPTLPDYRVKLTTSADVLIYQEDGIPSNQNTQQSQRLESTNPFVFLYDTDGTSGSRKYRIRAAGDSFEVQSVNDAESVFTTIIKYQAGILYSNATEVAVTSSGTFTGTLTGMTGSTTGTINYRKVNNLVSLWITNAISGTSNDTGMTMTGVPVALRPASGVTTNCSVTDDGNAALSCQASVLSAGSITFSVAKTNAVSNYVQFTSAGFTGSGAKGLPNGWSITYPLS